MEALKRLVLAITAAGGLSLSIGVGVSTIVVITPTEAVAEEVEECHTDTACDAARIQSNMSDYTGTIAPTTQTMVCVHVLAYEPSELVLAEGDQPAGAAIEGSVVTSWRVQTE